MKEHGIWYTGKNITKHFGQPYLLIILDEFNILADAMETHIGLRYTTHLINCHRHNKYFNSVCNCTVDLEFLRLQPKRTKMQNIQQGMKNEGKRKEA